VPLPISSIWSEYLVPCNLIAAKFASSHLISCNIPVDQISNVAGVDCHAISHFPQITDSFGLERTTDTTRRFAACHGHLWRGRIWRDRICGYAASQVAAARLIAPLKPELFQLSKPVLRLHCGIDQSRDCPTRLTPRRVAVSTFTSSSRQGCSHVLCESVDNVPCYDMYIYIYIDI
jgi:hypothetical protein